jgi:gliding motility-associated-like protein
MEQFYRHIVFLCLILSLSTAYSQITYLQEIYNGGITGDGYNQWASNQPGQLDVYIEPGSTIKRAILFASVIGDPEDRIANFNGTPIVLSASNSINDYYIVSYAGFNLRYRDIGVEVTELINPTINTYNLVPPFQNSLFIEYGAYINFYLLVLYENPLLPIINSNVFVNDIQPQAIQSYSLINLNPFDLSKSVGLGLNSDHFCDIIQDGSFISLDGSSLGLIGGEDDNQHGGVCGISSSFYHQNEQLFGLGNDIPNTTMNGVDGIASIESYILNSTFINIEFEYQSSLAPASNPVHQLFLAYTSPCETFSVTVPNDTTVCEGTQLQLNASASTGSATVVEWLPSTGLSCSNCPNPIFTADSSMFYTVRIWNNDSCSVVRPIKINVRPRPTFGEIVTTASECGSSTGSLTASSINALDELFAIDGNGTVFSSVSQNQSSATIGNLGAGNYTVYFIDTNGCQSADSIVFVDEINSTVTGFTANPLSGAAPLDVSLTNTSQNATNYAWSVNGNYEGNSLSNYTFDPSGTYVVTLVAWQFDPACADTAYKTIFVYDSLLVEIPNVFTPNGDGVNDFFSINTNMPINCHLVIVNRWGNVMQEFNGDIPAGTTNLWDASTGSISINSTTASVNEGVYFYTLRFDASSETPEGVKFLLPAEKEGFVNVER